MNAKNTLLYVDDEPHNLSAFRSTFGDEFHVFTASSAAEGYSILKKEKVHLIIADQRMPSESGVSFLAKARRDFPLAIRTILTGYSDIDSVIAAINASSIYYYFRKPWNEDELKLVFHNAIEALELSLENSSLLGNLNAALDEIRSKSETLDKNDAEKQDLVEKLNRANDIKSEFLSMISHELRTPLNPISGYTEVLELETKNERHKSYLQLIRRCGNDLLSLIDSILEFLDFGTSLPSSRLETFLPADLLSDLSMIAHSLRPRDRNIKISTVLMQDSVVVSQLPPLSIRLSAIRQIARNLIANACKFTNEGEIEITIELQSTSGRNLLLLSVRDTGIGIEIENQERIFEAFTQIDEGVSRRFEGVGLGLALCKRISNLLQGEIILESVPNKGSLFTLITPIEKANLTDLHNAADPANTSPHIDSLVLLNSNNNKNLLAFETILNTLGCRSKITTNSEMAAKLEADSYDAIILEFNTDLRRSLKMLDSLHAPNSPKPQVLVMISNPKISAETISAHPSKPILLAYPLRISDLAKKLAP